MIWQLSLQVILIILNAVFACAEIAVISFNDAKLEKLASSGDKRAKRLLRLTGEPAKFLATIQVAITLSGFIGSAFAADNFSQPLVEMLLNAGIGIPADVLKSISVFAITLILSYFTLVFGELVPKRLAMKKAEPLALGMSGLIWFISKIFAPIVWLLNASTNLCLRIVGIDPKGEDGAVTEEEILMMSEAGAEKGTIDKDDNRIIKNVFALDDINVNSICTHRTDVKYLFMDDSDEEWYNFIRNNRHSKFPICGETIDNIVGILDARDYLRLEDKSRENVMKNAVREPYFVHEYMKADVLFDIMKKEKSAHFTIILDEYGGMSGIITVTDIVEQLVGDFSEESLKDASDRIIRAGENEWVVYGIISLTDVALEMGIDLPTDKYETIGGYLLSYIENLPQNADELEIETDILTASNIKMKNHRIEKCTLHIKPQIK